jgi:hypothetical protein
MPPLMRLGSCQDARTPACQARVGLTIAADICIMSQSHWPLCEPDTPRACVDVDRGHARRLSPVSTPPLESLFSIHLPHARHLLRIPWFTQTRLYCISRDRMQYSAEHEFARTRGNCCQTFQTSFSLQTSEIARKTILTSRPAQWLGCYCCVILPKTSDA